MHGQICPVCNGEGKVSEEKGVSDSNEKPCHGCSGKGWIEVSDSYPLFRKQEPSNPLDWDKRR